MPHEIGPHLDAQQLMVAQVAVVHHVLFLPLQHVLLDLEVVNFQFGVVPARGLPVVAVIQALLLRGLLGFLLGLRGAALGLWHFFGEAVFVAKPGEDARGFGLIVEDGLGLHPGFNDIAIFLRRGWFGGRVEACIALALPGFGSKHC